MSQWNQLRLTLAVGVVLSIQLMWGVEQDARRNRPLRRAGSLVAAASSRAPLVHRTLAELHARKETRRA